MPRPGVLVTQAGDRGALLTSTLCSRGFHAEHVPLIHTVARAEAASEFSDVAPSDVWVFTSAAAVRAVASHAPAVARLQAAPAAYALGAGTWQELIAVAPQAAQFPGVRGAGDFAKRLVEACPPPVGFIFPRGRLALEVLPEELRRVGRRVAEWIVYDTILRPEAANRLAERSGDIVILFSPSAVSAIAAHPSSGSLFAPGRFAWLPFGGTTASALDRLGVRHLEPPPEPSHEALILHLETLYPMGA
ncbi:uroporphyrinogen-III synthase [Alicyclobacillus mali]|uniref:Uroporphyrinogen-III synthase n=1 Tax=Alicyclobacillus mali (ex Roth et al. 2021) TaxID=1123961 RepID=A0ABS0F625_9BACL|nr:uroporphyrinogen-III synthase [Alicyclobacillus mali (ex Roth et al. 2021)]MBF8378762.1 uroporphyrinogen-III synthase [Alicyclobacillus mali (ex Roth et al. 2021)]